MSELSRSLVDAAAAEAWMVQSASELTWRGQQRVRHTVAAVLETLAVHCDPVSVGDGSTSQALLANTELRALARAVLGEKEEQ